MRKSRHLAIGIGLLLCAMHGEAKPNFLIVLGDDVGYEAFGCSGNSFAKTPNVDQLAEEGMVFDRFYTTVAQCCPARAELYTGMLPHNNGVLTNGMGKQKDSNVKSMADYLLPLGYRVALAGKLNFWLGTPFEEVDGFQTAGKSAKFAYHVDGVRSFVQSARDEGSPFCLVIGSTHAHYPWNAGEPRMDEIDQIEVPEQYVDTPKTREILVRHAAEVTVLDRQLADVRAVLQEERVQEDTLILFLSEQGMSMPRGKWSVYEKGNRSLTIVHHPQTIQPGRTKALAQYCDVLPTLVDLAGGTVPDVDGFSFRDVLDGKTQTHRKTALLCGVNPTRQWAMVTDQDWRIVWSPAPSDRHLHSFYEDTSRKKRFCYAWLEWLELAKTDPVVARKVNHVLHPQEFEVYHIDTDYDELFNIALNPEITEQVAQLKKELNEMVAVANAGDFPPSNYMKNQSSAQAKGPDAYKK